MAKKIHTYTIKLLGPGYEYLMGKLPEHIFQYIETECGGDADTYMEKWGDDNLPEDMRLWGGRPWDFEKLCDDYFDAEFPGNKKIRKDLLATESCGCAAIDGARIEVTDENGTLVYQTELHEDETGNVSSSDTGKAPRIPYSSDLPFSGDFRYYVLLVKYEGLWMQQEVKDSQFDPSKLTLKSYKTNYDHFRKSIDLLDELWYGEEGLYRVDGMESPESSDGDFDSFEIFNAKPLTDGEMAELVESANLRGSDWAVLLLDRPQFADKCDKWDEMSGGDWASLLGSQPSFADRCDWSKLDGVDWAFLLGSQPQFADRCDWSKLDGEDWDRLLQKQPRFAKKRDLATLDGWKLAARLEKRPQLAEKCDWTRLNGEQWAQLLQRQPQFADKCDWARLDGWQWKELLEKQPQFADKCDWGKMGLGDLKYLLQSQPRIADKCDWSWLSGGDWADLLRERSQLADKCDWSKLDGWDWVRLLEQQPQFADKCNWSKLNGEQWVSLLGKRPGFADKCPRSKLNGGQWVSLLRDRPELADKCVWTRLSGEHWASLLEKRPQFADKCVWSKLNGGHWVSLLEKRPQFADKCDWSKLDNGNWDRLLEKQPQFAENRDRSQLDGRDWVSLLEKRPQFADKCDWSKLDGADWASLLEKRPQFADKCDKWVKLDSWDWVSLLEKRPQFADKCDWSKLDSWDWVRLLEKRPRFASKCDLSKLGGGHWKSLLGEQPRLANKCDWGKLSLEDLSSLFAKCPELRAVAKEKKGIRGKILQVSVIPEGFCYAYELGRMALKSGEIPNSRGLLGEDPDMVSQVIDDAACYVIAKPDANAEGEFIQVLLDGETLVEWKINVGKPRGLSFVDKGALFDAVSPREGRWLYGAGKVRDLVGTWTVEVPEDFSFDRGKLVIPFVRASAGAKGKPQLWTDPTDIRYGDMAPGDDTWRWHWENCRPRRADFWTVENGVTKPYDGPWTHNRD